MKIYQFLANQIEDADLKEIVLKGSSFFFIRAIGLVAGFIFTFLITKFFGADVYGLVSLSFTLILSISIIGVLGFDINLVKYYNTTEYASDKAQLYWVLVWSFLASIVLATVTYAFKDFIVLSVFNKPQFEPYFFWLCLTIPFWTLVLICGGFLRAKKLNHWFVFLSNTGRFTISVIAFCFLVLVSSSQNTIPIKAHFFGVFLLAIIGIIKSFKTISGFNLIPAKKTFSFLLESIPIMISSSIIVILGWTDTFFLGVYEIDKQVGIYNVALRLASLTIFPFMAINSILAPKISEAFYEGNQERLKLIIAVSTRISFLLTLAFGIIIIVFRKYLLAIFGEDFVIGDVSLIVLCLGQIFMSFTGFVPIILQMTGFQIVYTRIILVSFLLNITLNFLLIPKYGINGAAIATSATLIFWNLVGIIYIRRKLNIKSYFNL